MTDAANQTPQRDLDAMVALALANRAANFPVPPHVQEQLDAEKIDLDALEKEAADKAAADQAKADAKAAKAKARGQGAGDTPQDPPPPPEGAAGDQNKES